METMLFADELIDPGDIDELPDEDVRATEREVDMARQLIESLSTAFEPEKYRDEYRDRVLDLIERKAQGEEVSVTAEPEAPSAVPDLMAALEASLAAAKSNGGKAASAKPAAAPKKRAAKPAAAKKPKAKTRA
jgi:DNA end-binding protein Ku